MIPGSIGNIAGERLGGLLFGRQASPQQQLQALIKEKGMNSPEVRQMLMQQVALVDPVKALEMQQAMAQQAAKTAAKQKEAERIESQKLALFERAASLGLEMGPEIQNAAPDELGKIAEEIRDRQIELSSRGDDDKAVQALAKTAGIGTEDLKLQYGDNPPSFDEMKTIVERGDKGAIKAFVPVAGGQAKMYSTLGNKVLINGKWVQASAAGLAPAPQQVQTEELDGIFGRMPNDMKELVNGTVTNTVKQGQEASDTLAENARAQQLLDDGLFTGLGANAKVQISRVGAFFGIDNPTLERTQAFALERFGKVADIIQAYGAGTGLSDADREFALQQAGVPTLERATLERMLRIEKEVAQFQLTKANELIDLSVQKGLLTQDAADILQLARGSVPMPTTAGPSARSLQYIQ
tara:strand:+ start:1230 stop:2459 length:1230 start_codon:yes stop_codon:yes gene_type:complete